MLVSARVGANFLIDKLLRTQAPIFEIRDLGLAATATAGRRPQCWLEFLPGVVSQICPPYDFLSPAAEHTPKIQILSIQSLLSKPIT